MTEYGLAHREEEEDLLDFANYVFSLGGVPTDFRRLLPKVYGKPGFADISLIAKENGRIKGLANAVSADLGVGDELLRYAFIGTVCVHPYARGRGHMRRLMNLLLERCHEQGCHFLALCGQRQQYQEFGFENAVGRILLTFTKKSLWHTAEVEQPERYRFVRLDEAGEAALRLAVSLHGQKAIRTAGRKGNS